MRRVAFIAALCAAALPVRALASTIQPHGGVLRGDAVYFGEGDCPQRDELHDRAVVFVNFDGGTIFYSEFDDATQNRSRLFNGEWPAYGDGPQRAEVLAALREHWADFNVVFTDERPGSGPYTMVMVGPEVIVEGALGVAPVDCSDEVPANVVYAFVSTDDGLGSTAHAWTISHEVGHSFGLDHVLDQSDVMYESLAFGEPSFGENCTEIVAGPNGVGCPAQHAIPCDETYQSSWQDLHLLFGDPVEDLTPPTVWIDSPEDQDQIEENSPFTINVSAEDDTLVDAIDLHFIGDTPIDLPAIGDPFRWTLDEGLPEGGYSFYVVATDLAGNEDHSQVVNIGVGDAEPPNVEEVPEDPDPPDEEDTGGMDEGMGEDASADSDEAGCACTTGPSPGGTGLLGLGLLALTLRRRRPRSLFGA